MRGDIHVKTVHMMAVSLLIDDLQQRPLNKV
jgi:hypothetical protein